MKRIILIAAMIGIFLCGIPSVHGNAAEGGEDFSVEAKSAVLMEATTGTLLYAQNEKEALAPASVTKVMTLLLVMEAIESGRIALTDVVSISANAAGMGGSQVFMKEGEKFTVEELLKCCVIASANDAAVALSEHTCGSEKMFVAKMNERARELGLTETKFENVTGLDDTTTMHLTSAKDIAIMSQKLIQYPKITEYSRLWQDSIRDGAFTLTNTNRLVRYYKGCTGLKTGSTDKAGYCVSVTAERDGLSLICVVMGAENREMRNSIATHLLDYGFSHYGVFENQGGRLESISVLGGTRNDVFVESLPFSTVIVKSGENVNCRYEIPDRLQAPLKKGESVGKVIYELGGKQIGESDIVVCEDVGKISYMQVFWRLVLNFVMGANNA